jgi:hypothetical protein
VQAEKKGKKRLETCLSSLLHRAIQPARGSEVLCIVAKHWMHKRCRVVEEYAGAGLDWKIVVDGILWNDDGMKNTRRNEAQRFLEYGLQQVIL